MDKFLFGILPYLSVSILIIVSILRYRLHRFSFSSLSSQFLENRVHFWAMVPFHYGLIVVLLGHVMAFLIPRQILMWNAHPLRLFILETTALAFGLLTLVGIVGVMFRRGVHSKVRITTNVTDWILYVLLFLQIVSGIGVSIFMNWGASWFASSMSPYLWSLVKLEPEINFVSPMPFLVKFHIVTAYLTLLIFPLTRLVHILVVPLHYFVRQFQVVRWNYRKYPLEGEKHG